MHVLRFALIAVILSALPGLAAGQGGAARERASPFAGLGSGREPIKIDADRLDVMDRESRAVFTGNVVVVQGETTMKCSLLTVSYEARGEGGKATTAAALTTRGGADGAVRRIDCRGPVTIASKSQVATGDNATFDRVANRVLLTGNVALSDGPNVTRGEKLVYDLNSGVANVETAPGGRVRAMFVPGSSADTGAKPADAKPASPAADKPRRPPQPAAARP